MLCIFIEQSSQEINTAVIIAVLSFSFILILLYLSYKGYKSIIKKRDNNNHNDEIINVPSNDTNTSIPSFKYESTSTNQSQKIGISYINDSSETSDIEGVEPQTFCISPSFNCEIEIEQLPHSPNAYLDTEGCNSLYKEPHSQSKAVSTVNCSSCDEVSQSILLDKNTIPFGNSEALSSECVGKFIIW